MLHNLSEVISRLAPDATASATLSNGSRIVTAAADNTVRFWDTETEKQLAAIPMDAGVTNLTFTPDGTRLVIELDDGSARIFDTRSAEEQAADVQRRWAERVPAGVYLDTLMAGPTPTDELMATIETDPSLTPLRRLAAAEVLEERLADMKEQADRAFDAITKDQTDKTTVLTAARAADLPVRVKEKVLAKAEAWEYSPPKLTEEGKQLRLAEAELIVERIINHETPQYLDFDRSGFQEVVETRSELLGENHPETLKASWILGVMDFVNGRRDDGIDRMRTAATLYEKLVPPTDDLLIAMYDSLFQAELHTGQFEAAESWLDKLIHSFDAALDEPEGVIQPDFISGYGVLHIRFISPVIRLQYSNLYYPGSYQSLQDALSKIDSDLRNVKQGGLQEAALQGIRIGIWTDTSPPPRGPRGPWADCNRSLANTVVQLIPNDQRSQRPFALASYREGEYQAALDAITLAAKYRAAIPDDPATPMVESSPHPYDSAILAMAHFQLAQGLPESDPARVEHLAAANEALAQCQAIMADPEALNPDGNPWAEDRIAQSLLAEAEALIGGVGLGGGGE